MIVIVKTKTMGRYSVRSIAYNKKICSYIKYPTKIVTFRKLVKFFDKNYFKRPTLFHFRTASPFTIYKFAKKLENKGFRVINKAEVLRMTSDKLYAISFAKKHGIPTERCNNRNAFKKVMEMIKKWNYVVVKPSPSIAKGKFCYKFSKKTDTNLIKKQIKKIPSKSIQIQRFLKNYRLYRVIVINKKALKNCVTYNEPPRRGWKTSVCDNPYIKYDKDPPVKLLKLAEKIAKSFESEISFIDIFEVDNNFILNEINTACDLTFHEQKTKVLISKHIANYLASQYNRLT